MKLLRLYLAMSKCSCGNYMVYAKERTGWRWLLRAADLHCFNCGAERRVRQKDLAQIGLMNKPPQHEEAPTPANVVKLRRR